MTTWPRSRRLPLAILAAAALGCGSCVGGWPPPGPGFGGGSPSGAPSASGEGVWGPIKAVAMNSIGVAEGWGRPELLPAPLNSLGWEDSPSISPDGNTLTFAYMAADFHNYVVRGQGRPDRFEPFRRGPARGAAVPFAIDMFVSSQIEGGWTEPALMPVSTGTQPAWSSEAGLWLGANGKLYYNTNQPTSPTDFDTDIYEDGLRLPFCTDKDENDPHYVGGELLFWSDDLPGGLGGKDIWITRRQGEGWSRPAPLPAPVNDAKSNSWQPHLRADGTLLFTSNRDGLESIFSSERSGESWSAPVKIAWPIPGGPVLAIAEPTTTADGHWLYFAVLMQTPSGEMDLDVARMRRAAP